MTRRAKLKKPSQVLELYNQQLIEGLTNRLSPSEFELNYSFRSPKVASISGFAVFRNGTSHPHHKHLPGKVIESLAPDLIDVVNEVTALVIKNY